MVRWGLQKRLDEGGMPRFFEGDRAWLERVRAQISEIQSS